MTGNPLANGIWKQAGKLFISSVCGVLLTNLVDPQVAIFSRGWFLHVVLGSSILALTNEARYFKAWADSIGGNGNGDGNSGSNVSK